VRSVYLYTEYLKIGHGLREGRNSGKADGGDVSAMALTACCLPVQCATIPIFGRRKVPRGALLLKRERPDLTNQFLFLELERPNEFVRWLHGKSDLCQNPKREHWVKQLAFLKRN
jgi:hypothetical protein